ncbi:MAG: aspartate aminotransferase family protein [Candidatus Heimdallarchaeota archaeon]|nr:MAG: aspartate aminotransferase family protein [Candidatus Heimdallarchaeota archaeon]
MKFEEFSLAEAPKIKGDLPGIKSKMILKRQREIEGSALSYPLGLPIVMEEGRGATVKDVDGNVFIDFFAGAGVLALGHCNPIILEAVKKQQNKITHTLDFPTEIRLELIENLRKIMPGTLKDSVKVQFGGPTGSDAVESAIKLAKYNTGRHALIAFEGGYHGMTATACSLTSGKFWKEKYLPMISEVHFIPYAYCYRCSLGKTRENCEFECAAFYEHVLEDPHSGVVQPAAAIIEPIQGEGGSIVPPDEYIKRISEISRSYNVPIIFDEIQAGFCRTGEIFSFQHAKASPDIITLSKALGGGFPLSAIAYREDLDVWGKAAHIGTFRGNVTAMAAGVASIQFFIEHNINNHVNEVGSYILNELKTLEISSNIVGDVRGKGLMLGVEFVENKETKKPATEIAARVREESFIRGILLEIGGHYNNVARFLPPLIITKELAGIGVQIFEEAVNKVEKDIH